MSPEKTLISQSDAAFNYFKTLTAQFPQHDQHREMKMSGSFHTQVRKKATLDKK